MAQNRLDWLTEEWMTGEGRRAQFDLYCLDYEAVMNRALAATGETVEYFARLRVEGVHKQLKRLDFRATTVLDYGCGTGGATPFFAQLLRPRRLLGVDVSPESVRVARQRYRGKGVEFAVCGQCQPQNEFHLAFCNGVFHHVTRSQREAALQYVHRALRPGGVFALWENNPWNPGTHYVMSRCEFDRGARMFSIVQARELLRSNGFEVMHSSSHFYFPRWLKWLRALEARLANLPLGGQYLVLGRKTG